MKDKQILALSHQLPGKKCSQSASMEQGIFFFFNSQLTLCTSRPPCLYLLYHTIMSKPKRKWGMMHLLKHSCGPSLVAINLFCSCLVLLSTTGYPDCCEDEMTGTSLSTLCQCYLVLFCLVALSGLIQESNVS